MYYYQKTGQEFTQDLLDSFPPILGEITPRQLALYAYAVKTLPSTQETIKTVAKRMATIASAKDYGYMPLAADAPLHMPLPYQLFVQKDICNQTTLGALLAATYTHGAFKHQISTIKYLLEREQEMRLQTADLAIWHIESYRAQNPIYLNLLEKAITYHASVISKAPLQLVDMQKLARTHRKLTKYCSASKRPGYVPRRFDTLHLMSCSLTLNSQDPSQAQLLPKQTECAVEILHDLAALVVNHFTCDGDIQAMLGLLSQTRKLSADLELLPEASVTKFQQSCLILKSRNIEHAELREEV